ncbi:peptidase M15 [Lacinutrix sp. WUR7]|uniref:D-Ala-D-Ala carboxypeptidase family metallohydrolase n=1 Tax=Lacinutrix sp. WUR7 TaxID=2653681 RepID=UPI00193E9275|nr:D-Ala-D-Ala carboxypeptidase family metallohydrolase [Lacinutrix sp. WUR7]QRM89512.1 peptidase M15 [Lacinutrix sp. WUR7]
MVKSNNQHIYVGLGTLSVLLIGAFLVYKKQKSKKKPVAIVSQESIDLSAFDSPDLPGSGNCMDRHLIFMLQQLEALTGYPIFSWINSGARSPSHNRKVGGVSNSSHKMPTCKAVDIKAYSTSIRNNLVQAARDVGFKRIGVGRTFVHLDTDDLKSQYVAWGYPSGVPAEVNPFV